MRKIAFFLVFVILGVNISNGFSIRKKTVTLEKIIPFSFVADGHNLQEDISVKGYTDVKIKDMYVDNGKMAADISGNYIEVDFSDGEWANSYKVINKVESIALCDVPLTDESNKTIVITPDKVVKNIQSVSGDFYTAKVNSDGNIEVKVKSSESGIMGYDKSELIKSEFTINIDAKNINREIKSEAILPYEVVGDIIPKSGDTSMVKAINVDGSKVTIDFSNGIPVANETTIQSGYTFFWIDRDENGLFRPYNPNSIYSTDINKISGKGEYIGENEREEIGLDVKNDKWLDYCGIEKDGVRYIYTFDSSKGTPKEFLGNLLDSDSITFDEQNLNSEKYTVYFSNAGVSYIPEGKLYSMGELVKDTLGWGEVSPNKDWESEKKFFNELTGKYETYVRHFKFFYGPKIKRTFGGFYTYPYSCTFEYEHYKPVECFSGDIVYEYESKEKVKGYSYNGWIKIQYTDEIEVNDYPPIAPFNVRYNSLTGDITWDAGNDDYTPKEKLIYEVWIFDGTWKEIAKNTFSELVKNYLIDYLEPDVKIRTVDEYGQVSEWAYLSDSNIEISGKLGPYIVKPGDTIDIFAKTNSFEKIQSVIAKNDKMQMYTELQKLEEKVPNFIETSFDIDATFPEYIDEYFEVGGRVALGNKEIIDTYKFEMGEKFDNGSVITSFVEDMTIDKNGTVIFSNINYNDIPVDMFYYNSKCWYLIWANTIYIENKTKNTSDIFFKVESNTEVKFINNRKVIEPKHIVTINTFRYDANGNVRYEEIEVDKKYLSKPFSLSWNTDVYGVTKFCLYSGCEVIYEYEAIWDDINKHVNNIKTIHMYKMMKKYSKASYGYTTPNKNEIADWNMIVLSIATNYDLRKFPWLGYKVKKNEYVNKAYIEEYNSNPKVRNNYRFLFCDDTMSDNAIKKYTDILKNTNISMSREEETVFGKGVMEYTSTFQGLNIKIPEETDCGTYEIDLIATDIYGNMADCKLTLIVQQESIEDDKKEDSTDEENSAVQNYPTIVDNFFGRFFYRENKGYLEEFKKTETSQNGFICAGETLGISLVAKDTEYIEIEFSGDESINTLDDLSKRFLIEMPAEKGKDTSDIEYQYISFSKKIYPQYVDKSEMKVFKWFYTIPYGTKQTLESWSSLKNDILEKIDTSRIFERKTEPYVLSLYLNGDRENAIHLSFDVFERWDTVLNRDITEFVVNSDTRWEMRIDK